MTDFLLTLLKNILAVTPILLLILLCKKVNLDKSVRSRQFLMPPIAFLYVLIMLPLVSFLSDWLLYLVNGIPNGIDSLAGVSYMPGSVSDPMYGAADRMRQGIENSNLNYWIFYAGNVVIMLVYLSLKKTCLGIFFKKFKDQSNFHDKIAEIFYQYFPDHNVWCVRNQYGNARTYLKAMYYAAIAISLVVFLISAYCYDRELLNGMLYPVLCVIVLGELYFFLDGNLRREYICDVLGESEETYRTVNYSLLRKFLRGLFHDKLLTENTVVNGLSVNDETNDDVIQRLENSDDPKISAFGAFVRKMNRSGYDIDHNYLRSSIDLLNGKSILFNNPFYYDLIPYAFYPMNRVLLQHKKVLVVLGRHATENDAEAWLTAGVESVTNIPYLWNIGVLSKSGDTPDIGIVTRSDIFDAELQEAHAKFFEDVEFVFILEPGKLMATAQIGLNLLVKKCRQGENKDITFCLIDKNCDGLVDSLSHALMTNLTEVSATRKHAGTMSYMCWEADEDYLHHRIVPNISRYLGVGTELSFAALKNQVEKVSWYGGEAFPVYDISWINQQYYYDLTKYAGIPASQSAIEERMRVSASLWDAKAEKNSYITAEDESFNMFEILRDFSTRSKEQGFVNVISSEYLLKDYMADNAALFESDAKAIPYIVADYVRTGRNTLLRLLLMMNAAPVKEEFLVKELSLLGIKVRDLPKQLWYEIYKYFSDTRTMATIPEDYWTAVEFVSAKDVIVFGETLTIDIIRKREQYNLDRSTTEVAYALETNTALTSLLTELRSAEYIAEDEKGHKNYLGAELCGHVYQKYLPGQFFTFGGKYYEMLRLTSEGQVLLRRAADHINGRMFYRQIREYELSGLKASDEIGARKNISGLKVAREYADLQVRTPGYYRLNRYNNFANAKKILFEGEKNGIPERTFRQKEILRIDLPFDDSNKDPRIVSTVTMLFNETFRTLFAENQAYICAVCSAAPHSDENRNFLTYSLKGNGVEISENSIYIIEDSQIDLGLITAVERNLERIFQLIADYLDWHKHYLEESEQPTPPSEQVVFVPRPAEENTKKKGFFRRILDAIKNFFRRIFRRKKKNVTFSKTPSGDSFLRNTEGTETPVADIPAVPNDISAGPQYGEPQDPDTQGDGIIFVTEDDKVVKHPRRIYRKPYHERHFMLFGYAELSEALAIDETLDYLSELDFSFGPLKQARDGKDIADMIAQTYDPRDPNRRFCDFCGVEICGVEYETLADGRDRCLQCGKTAVKTGEEFRKIFAEVKRNMESFYGIQLNTGIRVEMVNSKKLHKLLGDTFVPTPGFDGRTLGVAIRDRSGNYKILIENGAPRVRSMMTLAHELTHIWQYLNWNEKHILAKYGKAMNLEIYEGMAKWVEVQYAYLINETEMGKREEILSMMRDDEYGRGFLRYVANYPLTYGTVLTGPTPFKDRMQPLDPKFCGSDLGVPIPAWLHVPDGSEEAPSTPEPVVLTEFPTAEDPASVEEVVEELPVEETPVEESVPAEDPQSTEEYVEIQDEVNSETEPEEQPVADSTEQ